MNIASNLANHLQLVLLDFLSSHESQQVTLLKDLFAPFLEKHTALNLEDLVNPCDLSISSNFLSFLLWRHQRSAFFFFSASQCCLLSSSLSPTLPLSYPPFLPPFFHPSFLLSFLSSTLPPIEERVSLFMQIHPPCISGKF